MTLLPKLPIVANRVRGLPFVPPQPPDPGGRAPAFLQYDSDQTLQRVSVALAILQVLDSNPADTRSLQQAVTNLAGTHKTRRYFHECLAGLVANGYIHTHEGLWLVTGKGAH